MTTSEALDRAFAPRSVAIAGSAFREPAEQVLKTLTAAGFRGWTCLVDRQGAVESGRKVYRSVKEIPGPVDYVVCCQPAAEVLPLLGECAAKRVGVVAILTGGFVEGGGQRGAALERQISSLARETGLRVIGPDCLGVYSPQGGLSFDPGLPSQAGRMGFVGQGREAPLHIVRAAASRGVRFSKAISCGDGCDLGESDFLEYFARDRETDAVGVMVEGVRDGPKFLRALKNLSAIKPVIALRTTLSPRECVGAGLPGGDGGIRGPLWEAVWRQTGAIGVSRAEDMVDMMVTFSLLPRPQGRRVGIFGAAGGASVLATDTWCSRGFTLPPVPRHVRASFDEAALNQAGMILHNPLDFSMSGYTAFFYEAVRKMMAERDFIDISVIHNPSGQGAWMPWPFFESLIRSIADGVIGIHRQVPLPTVLVMHYIHNRRHWQKIFEDLQVPCAQAGIPVYYSMASAARSIDRMLSYYGRRAKSDEGRGC